MSEPKALNKSEIELLARWATWFQDDREGTDAQERADAYLNIIDAIDSVREWFGYSIMEDAKAEIYLDLLDLRDRIGAMLLPEARRWKKEGFP